MWRVTIPGLASVECGSHLEATEVALVMSLFASHRPMVWSFGWRNRGFAGGEA